MTIEKHHEMLTEPGIVVAVASDALWVETIQQSTCSTCAAQKGCGQKLLSKMGTSSTQLKVSLEAHDPKVYQVGDSVTVAIAAETVLKSSLFIYFLPLLMMFAFAGFAHTFIHNEIASVVLGILGLLMGGVVIRYHSYLIKGNTYFQPVLFSAQESVIATDVIQHN